MTMMLHQAHILANLHHPQKRVRGKIRTKILHQLYYRGISLRKGDQQSHLHVHHPHLILLDSLSSLNQDPLGQFESARYPSDQEMSTVSRVTQ